VSDDQPPAPTGIPTPVALHVRVWNPGAARRVLVLHGLGSDGGTCWSLAEAVAAAGATAVAPDLRNHGLSPTTSDLRITAYAADVALLADAWDLVVGHSLGGSVLAELCARPGFARRGLLLDPVLLLHDEDRQPLRDGLGTEVGGVLTRARLDRQQPHWSVEDRHRKVLAAATVSSRTTDLTCDHNDPWDVRAHIGEWACPVHLVVADPDEGTLCPPDDVAAARSSHPGVTSTTIPGAGHSLHRDDPAAVAALIAAELAR
jgi:pimeloyl-ACP methyl ester carboxylesterase